MEKYETIEQLGEGAFAVVTKAKDLNTGAIVAIKKLKKKYSNWQDCVDLREVKSLNVLKKHDNIIKLKEMIRVEDILYLVFEYMEKNLYELMTQRQTKKFTESQIKCVMWQTVQGLAYMHKYGFFHRDLKPENLLVCGDVIKLADFGLAREIRSLPPYTDYVSTRYYRAPECILKSTNYNSPVDIWALGCIMIEMYNLKPVFIGNTEKEVLFRMCSVLGTPTNSSWSEGIQLAKKIDLKFPTSAGTSLSQVVPDASKEALDFIGEMLKWDPNKRSTASSLLQHPFFTSAPIPTRISTPEYNNKFNVTGKQVKSYSNVPPQKNYIKENNPLIESTKKDDNEFIKLLDDTKVIKKMKNQKIEDDIKYLEQKNVSAITNKLDDEFDFEMPTYFKDNQSIIDNKTLYSNNSILNANLSNIGIGSSVMGMTTNLNQNHNNIYNYNKNFFDTTTINNINAGAGSRNGSIGSNGSLGSSIFIINLDEKDLIEVSPKDNAEDLFTVSSRRKNVTNNNLGGILENVSNEIMKKEEEKKKKIERIENELNMINKKSNKELDFDNCNVYLKGNETENNTNTTYSRKRSAMRFIENTLEKNNQINSNITNSIKSTKDPLNDKILNNNFGNNLNNKPSSNFSFKNSITSTNAINNPSQSNEKKEFQSRRKNQANNILNDLDNPRVVDINLNSNISNKPEIDKNDHSQQNHFRKVNNLSGNNVNLPKDMLIGDNSYIGNTKKEYGHTNTTRSTNNNNSSMMSINTNNDPSLGFFNSRRHVTNTSTLNNLTNSNINSNTNSLGGNKPQVKEGNKDKKFLII